MLVLPELSLALEPASDTVVAVVALVPDDAASVLDGLTVAALVAVVLGVDVSVEVADALDDPLTDDTGVAASFADPATNGSRSPDAAIVNFAPAALTARPVP